MNCFCIDVTDKLDFNYEINQKKKGEKCLKSSLN